MWIECEPRRPLVSSNPALKDLVRNTQEVGAKLIHS